MSTRHIKQSQLIKEQTLLEERLKRGRRKVDPVNNPLDFRASVMAGFGLSAGYISSQTGFSTGQIYYRLRLAGIHIADYRNGRGIVAKRVYEAHHDEVEPALRRQIAAVVKAHQKP